MDPPADTHLPFFAYGIFRPGQVGYFQLREFVNEIPEPLEINGTLLLRDGLPIIDPTGDGRVRGALLRFQPTRANEAYDRIAAMEPDKHYRWGRTRANGAPMNVLFGRSPKQGSVYCEDAEWNGWEDPLFTFALEVIEETLHSCREFKWDLKPLFKLQMAYLLLWTAIERYVSLRYHLGVKVTQKVNQLACEPAFSNGLKQHVKHCREVYRADRPEKR